MPSSMGKRYGRHDKIREFPAMLSLFLALIELLKGIEKQLCCNDPLERLKLFVNVDLELSGALRSGDLREFRECGAIV